MLSTQAMLDVSPPTTPSCPGPWPAAGVPGSAAAPLSPRFTPWTRATGSGCSSRELWMKCKPTPTRSRCKGPRQRWGGGAWLLLAGHGCGSTLPCARPRGFGTADLPGSLPPCRALMAATKTTVYVAAIRALEAASASRSARCAQPAWTQRACWSCQLGSAHPTDLATAVLSWPGPGPGAGALAERCLPLAHPRPLVPAGLQRSP